MIIEFAEERTLDPMPEVMKELFEKSKILISTKVLNVLKKMHAYTKTNNQYTFHRRISGTNVLFSFGVTEGPKWNTVSGLECIITEASVAPKNMEAHEQDMENVYFIIKGEEKE